MNLVSLLFLILLVFDCEGLVHPVTTSTITILIPDYRDIKCSYTLHNIYLKSAHPARVYVSLVQERYHNDPNCVKDLQNNSLIPESEQNWITNNVRFITKDAKDAVGLHLNVYQAELLAQTVHKIEDNHSFVIKIDAHSDFLYRYDDLLIELFNKIGDEMGVISSYPLGVEFIPELGFNTSLPKVYGKMCIIKQNNQGLLFLPVELTDWINSFSCFKRKGYCKGFFVPGGFHFARTHLIKNVSYDRYLSYFFNGEQFLFSARLYTHGYNIYTPALNFVFHIYGKGWTTRLKFQADKHHDQKIYDKSYDRYRKLLNIKLGRKDNNSEMKEIERFGLGNKRTLEEFYNIIGIDRNKEYFKNTKLMKHGILNACQQLDKLNNSY